tara:strand:- start:157 stop:567 length:411 start_codon:yes stop_codon:yes gene_type:complete
MNKFNLIAASVLLFASVTPLSYAEYLEVTVPQPSKDSIITSPAQDCMKPFSVEYKSSLNVKNKEIGHVHIMVDVNLTSELSKPINISSNYIAIEKNSPCMKIDLSSIKQTIRTLYADDTYVRYDSVISDSANVDVK